MPESQTAIKQIANSDPLGNILRNRLRFTPLLFGLLVLILDILVDGWMGWFYGIFLHPAFPGIQPGFFHKAITDIAPMIPPGILQDFMALTTDLAYLPILCGLYLWSPSGSTHLLRNLFDSGIFVNKNEFKKIVDKYQSVYVNPWAFAVNIVVSLTLSILQLGAYLGWFPWKTVGGYIDGEPIAAFYRFPFWILLFYTLIFAVYNVAVTILILRKAFRQTRIQILPLHPDRCGGLGSISHYTNMVGLGIGTVGLVLSAATLYEALFGDLGKAIPVIAGIVVYLILAPLFFFLPLGSAHESMRKAKEDELLSIARRFTLSYKKLKAASNTNKDNEKKLKHLVNLKDLYALADSFPVWPFDVSSLRKFLTIITAPIIPALAAVIEVGVSALLDK